MDHLVYLDHAATTAARPEVVEAMLPYFTEKYGNPSSIYSLGSETKAAITHAREIMAKSIGTTSENIYFTAGGSESDNWALVATAEAYASKGKHIITSKIEHHAILHTCDYLASRGYEITYIDVDENGVIKLDQLKAAIRPDTILISVMFANNEIGTIEPIHEIGKIAKDIGIIFHTDAVQAVGNVDIDVKKLNIDALSLSAHKFYGPKGVGAAYISSFVKFEPVINGGHQECSKRAGTENVPGIVGLGKAIEIATSNIIEHSDKVKKIRDELINDIESGIEGVILNGDRKERLCSNVNFCIDGIDSESLVLMLDMNGICASSGSACTAGILAPSHVLTAIGRKDTIATSSIRFTFGEENTSKDVKVIYNVLKDVVTKLRKNKRTDEIKCKCTNRY